MTRRMLATLQCDMLLQYRNGFYWVTAFMVALWIVFYTQFPLARQIDMAWVLPGFLLGNMLVYAFYYIGALVLLEKGEGTLESQVTTPLRGGEYLLSKVITLTLLSIVESLVITVLFYGAGFQIVPLLLGISMAGVLYALLGFIAVSRYDSVNEYLFPSMVFTLAFGLPLVDYYGLVKSWLFYLHPLQAPLSLLTAAFRPLALWEWLYALLYGGLWLYLLYRVSRNAFSRFVIRKEGVR
jgi:fluoroquinolone transport system permease protein